MSQQRKPRNSSSFPSLAFCYFLLCQYLVLAPIAAYREFLPDFITYLEFEPISWASVIFVSIGHAILAICITALLSRNGKRRLLAMILVAFPFWFATYEVIYYVKFRSYPGGQLLQDFYASPLVFLSYTGSGITTADWIIFALSVLFVTLISLRAVAAVVRTPTSFKRVGAYFLLSIFAISLGQWLARQAPVPERYIAREHSIPSYRWYVFPSTAFAKNSFTLVRRFLPLIASEPPTLSEHPKHVLLIILECVRARNLSLSGYARDTTPHLRETGNEWISINRAYAQGPGTANSFPVIFRSRYMAGVDLEEQLFPNIADYLGPAGIHTAIFSAGVMTWKNLAQLAGFSSFQTVYHAGLSELSERRIINRTGTYYAVDDRVIINKYKRFIEHLDGAPSFAVMHIVGTHHPYLVPDKHRIFLPDISSEGIPTSQADVDERNINSYDNSIHTVDEYIEELTSFLGQRNLLSDSIITVTADHGEAFGEHQHRFHGTSLYDEQVHVPLLFHVGKNLPTIRETLSARVNDIVTLVDLLPTFTDLFQITTPPAAEGLSLLRSARKPYHPLLLREAGAKVAIVEKINKYIYDIYTGQAFSFDLSSDPLEEHNTWRFGQPKNLEEFLKTLESAGVIAATSK